MNEDPTRLMSYDDEPPRRRRDPNPPKGNLRLVVLIMGVIIFGLLIGLVASCGGGETKTVTQTRTITEEIQAKPTQKEAEEEEPEGAEGEEAEEGAEGEGEEGEESAESQEAREIQEAQEIQEIEEAEAAEAESGGIEELPEEEFFEEEPEGGGVGAGE
jgi:hypothetical protein